ncbi:MAG: rhomboid family intramembrane serine protease [Balneolales bacterium]|nr:rhomboid family intramembrane serine protease [Balneolales bacterium]
MLGQSSGLGAPSVFPPGVKHLLIVNILFFIAQGTPVIGMYLEGLFVLYPPMFGIGFIPLEPGVFYPWQLITYMFLHGNFSHILFNLFALWIFGQQIEAMWGTKRFVTYYFLCGIGAGILHMIVAPNPVIGASGGVFGILLAFGMLFPNREIFLLFPPIPIKAKYLVIGYGAFELFNGVFSTMSGVAHFAHLGGMLVGFILIRYWKMRTNLD